MKKIFISSFSGKFDKVVTLCLTAGGKRLGEINKYHNDQGEIWEVKSLPFFPRRTPVKWMEHLNCHVGGQPIWHPFNSAICDGRQTYCI
jgi:hypothetical protein